MSNRRKVIVEGIGQLRRAVNRVTVAFDFFYVTIINFVDVSSFTILQVLRELPSFSSNALL